MILPILLTTNWVSAVAFDESSKKAIDTFFSMIPYTPNKFESVITSKRLDSLLEKWLLKLKLKKIDVKKIIISNFNLVDIHISYSYKDLCKKLPYPYINLDYFMANKLIKMDKKQVNEFQNYLEYKIPLNFDQRIAAERVLLKEFIENNVSDFLDRNEVIIGVSSIDDKQKEKQIKLLIEEFADTINVVGVWKFFIDYDFALLPYIVGLMSEGLSVDDFFKENTLQSYGKLIIAPGVEEIETRKEQGDEKSEVIKINPGALNYIDLGENDYMHLKWKSPKAKFDGQIYGSMIGLVVDTRERKNNR